MSTSDLTSLSLGFTVEEYMEACIYKIVTSRHLLTRKPNQFHLRVLATYKMAQFVNPPSAKQRLSRAFRRERRAKIAWFSKRDQRWRGLAVITVIYFPGAWLECFIKHYLNQESTDIFILNLSNQRDLGPCVASHSDRVNVVNIPCDCFDDWSKSYHLETFSSMLRMRYTYTIVADVDELIFAYSKSKDLFLPSISQALRDIDHQSVIRCFGLNVLERGDSKPLDFEQPINQQRELAHPVSPMNKPCIMGDYHLVLPGQHFTDAKAPCIFIQSASDAQESYLFCLLHLKHAWHEVNIHVRQQFKNVAMGSESLKDYYRADAPLHYTEARISILAKKNPESLGSDHVRKHLADWNKSLSESPWKDLFTRYVAPRKDAPFLVHIPASSE